MQRTQYLAPASQGVGLPGDCQRVRVQLNDGVNSDMAVACLIEVLNTSDIGSCELLGGQVPGGHLSLKLGHRGLEERKSNRVLVTGDGRERCQQKQRKRRAVRSCALSFCFSS